MYSAIGLGIQICIETCIFPLMFFFQFSFSSQKEEVKSWAKDALAIFAVILVDLGRYCLNGMGKDALAGEQRQVQVEMEMEPG